MSIRCPHAVDTAREALISYVHMNKTTFNYWFGFYFAFTGAGQACH